MINVGSATNSHPARTLVMGVVNVTPNSFSDGGMWADPEVAIRHARDLVVEGADIIDVGGESTRPGTERTPEHEELRRVLPVVKALVADGVAVSVDTMRASVAKAVVEAGATIVNDVSGGKAEPEILDVVADAGVDYVLMHWRGQSATMQNLVDYDDVVATSFLRPPSRSTQLLPLESTVGASSSTRALVSPRLPSTTGSS